MYIGMVPQVAEATLQPTVTALARAIKVMARREGAPLNVTPNTPAEQRAHKTPTRFYKRGAKYTHGCGAMKATFSPTVCGWYTSFLRTKAMTEMAQKYS